MAILVHRTTPLSDPRRLSCGHLKSRRLRQPWCSICRPYSVINGRNHWRKTHKGKIPRQHIYRRSWGYGLASRRPKKVRQNTKRARALAYSLECHRIRWLLFRVGQGRQGNLSPRDQDTVRQYFHSRYDEYLTRMKFADRKPLSYYHWRQKSYGGMKAAYGRDIVKGMKMETAIG